METAVNARATLEQRQSTMAICVCDGIRILFSSLRLPWLGSPTKVMKNLSSNRKSKLPSNGHWDWKTGSYASSRFTWSSRLWEMFNNRVFPEQFCLVPTSRWNRLQFKQRLQDLNLLTREIEGFKLVQDICWTSTQKFKTRSLWRGNVSTHWDKHRRSSWGKLLTSSILRWFAQGEIESAQVPNIWHANEFNHRRAMKCPGTASQFTCALLKMNSPGISHRNEMKALP